MNYKNLLLIDLDGTIRKTKSGEIFINKPDDQEPIENTPAILDWFKKEDYKIIGISNQAGIEHKFKTLESTIEEMKITLKMFPQLSMILFCPNMSGTECIGINDELDECNLTGMIKELDGTYRKPNTGMIELAKKWEQIHYQTILIIGDRDEDKQAAINAKIEFMYNTDMYNLIGNKIKIENTAIV